MSTMRVVQNRGRTFQSEDCGSCAVLVQLYLLLGIVNGLLVLLLLCVYLGQLFIQAFELSLPLSNVCAVGVQ